MSCALHVAHGKLGYLHPNDDAEYERSVEPLDERICRRLSPINKANSSNLRFAHRKFLSPCIGPLFSLSKNVAYPLHRFLFSKFP